MTIEEMVFAAAEQYIKAFPYKDWDSSRVQTIIDHAKRLQVEQSDFKKHCEALQIECKRLKEEVEFSHHRVQEWRDALGWKGPLDEPHMIHYARNLRSRLTKLEAVVRAVSHLECSLCRFGRGKKFICERHGTEFDAAVDDLVALTPREGER